MERGSAPPTLLRRRFSAAFSYFIPALYYDYFFPRSYLVLFSRFLLSTLGRLLLCTLRFYFAAFFYICRLSRLIPSKQLNRTTFVFLRTLGDNKRV